MLGDTGSCHSSDDSSSDDEFTVQLSVSYRFVVSYAVACQMDSPLGSNISLLSARYKSATNDFILVTPNTSITWFTA